ncbi:MAG: glycosyltransferase family 4 protein [Candidatus Melainabacteria bacterium]|nr:glycosyltransferase family 4 protein [Candidatus Melainabacteria bacterium]
MEKNDVNNKFHLAVITSHPIQYQAPFFREIAKYPEIDLKVFFCSDWGLKLYKDSGFGQEIKWDILLLDGYNFEFLPNKSPFPNVSRFWGLINPQIIRKIKEENFDAVWVHGWSSFTNLLTVLTAYAKGVPVLLRGESNLLHFTNSPVKNWLKEKILKMLFKKISAFLAIGKYNSEFYESYGVPKEKIYLVPYTVDNDFFFSKAQALLPKKNELKKKFNIPVDLPVILFSGKFISKKNPMDLLSAYVEVEKKTKAALVFVGDGVLRNEMEAFARENQLQYVYFMGFRNQSELPEFYAMSDVFVLPSEFEPWGLVVNEAMCFNLPIIVSDKVGAGGDLLRDGENGFVYPSGNVRELVVILSKLLSNPELIKKMGRCSADIIKYWSYNEGVKGILKYYEQYKKLKH